MKTIFRFLSVAMLLSAASVTGAFAQATPAAPDVCNEPAATSLYEKFVATYAKKPPAKVDKEAAIQTGKQFLEKYGACANWKEQVDFINPWIPKLEKAIVDIDNAALFTRFDAAVKADNAEEIYAAGKLILAKQPENLNIVVPLGVAGMREIPKKNFKFNDDTLRHASMALSAIKGGAAFPKKDKNGVPVIGAFQYEYNRDNAISQLTYVLGYVNYFGKNDKKAAMPYFYEALQLPGPHKDSAFVYNAIGDYYTEAAAPLGLEIGKLIGDLQKATDEAEKIRLNELIKPKVALFNGYTERAMDAIGRAHKMAKSDTPALKTFKEGLYKRLQDLYKLRFDKLDGMDAWIATTTAKPLPNPTSEVTPVADPEPTTTTTSTTTTPVAPVTAKPATTTAKPAATTAKPATTTAKPAPTTTISSTGTTATPSKVVAKKTVAVRKANR